MSDDTKTAYTGEWDLIESSSGASIQEFRQRVPGGWLVLCSAGPSSSVTFLPDPNGEWNPPIKQSRKKGFA